jgi:F0F1-type ATP synthase assembly protein I
MGLLGIGWYFAVCIVGGILGGLLLDNWLGTEPLFTMLGLFLGLAFAAYGGYKALMRVMATTSDTPKGPEQD